VTIGRGLLAVLLVGAGIMHFVKTGMYVAIVPSFPPDPRLLVGSEDLVEMALPLSEESSLSAFRLGLWLRDADLILSVPEEEVAFLPTADEDHAPPLGMAPELVIAQDREQGLERVQLAVHVPDNVDRSGEERGDEAGIAQSLGGGVGHEQIVGSWKRRIFGQTPPGLK